MAEKAPQRSLRDKLAAGARRLRLNEALGVACWMALLSLGTVAVLGLVQRLFFLGDPVAVPVLSVLGLPAWTLWSALGLLLAPAAAGAAVYALSRKGPVTAAMAADERLGLRARLSSALVLDAAGTRSPMAPELLADARRYGAALRVRRDFPLELPRWANWARFTGILGVILVVILLPQWDLMGRRAQAKEREDGREEIRLVAERLQKRLTEALKRKPPAERKARNLPSHKLQEDLGKLLRELKEADDREEAIARINKLLDKAKLSKMRLAAMERMVRQMEQLEKMGEKADLPKGKLGKFAMAMAAGDFKKAAAELAKLKDEMAGGKLTDKQKADLKRELERLAKLTDDWKELAEQFEKAAGKMGDKEALEAMAAAMENLKELWELLKELGLEKGDGAGGLAGEGQQIEITKEMIDELKKMLKNAQRCAKCKKLYCFSCNRPRCGCEGEEQCDCQPGEGQGMGVPIPGPGGGGMGQGQGQGSGPGGQGSGPGTGGMGQGEGGKPPESEHGVDFKTTKARSKMGVGKIVGHMVVRGEPTVTGEKQRAEYRKAHAAAAKAASEEVESGRIPRDLRDYVRQYFTSTKLKGSTAPAKDTPKKGD